jgi:hypothetical protein
MRCYLTPVIGRLAPATSRYVPQPLSFPSLRAFYPRASHSFNKSLYLRFHFYVALFQQLALHYYIAQFLQTLIVISLFYLLKAGPSSPRGLAATLRPPRRIPVSITCWPKNVRWHDHERCRDPGGAGAKETSSPRATIIISSSPTSCKRV